MHLATTWAMPPVQYVNGGIVQFISVWSQLIGQMQEAYLVKAPHAQAGLAGSYVRPHKGGLQGSCPGSKLGGLLELAQHQRSRRAIGGVGRHVRRQVSRCLVRLQSSLHAVRWTLTPVT